MAGGDFYNTQNRNLRLTGRVRWESIAQAWRREKVVTLMVEEIWEQARYRMPGNPSPGSWTVMRRWRQIRELDLPDPALRWIVDGPPKEILDATDIKPTSDPLPEHCGGVIF
jgi:hypothetical protein